MGRGHRRDKEVEGDGHSPGRNRGEKGEDFQEDADESGTAVDAGAGGAAGGPLEVFFSLHHPSKMTTVAPAATTAVGGGSAAELVSGPHLLGITSRVEAGGARATTALR